MDTRKCLYCQKVYFIVDGEPCPFCGRKDVDFNPFKEIFGDDNPFSTSSRGL